VWARGLSHLTPGVVLWSPQHIPRDPVEEGVLVPNTEVITEENAWIESDFSLIEHPMRVLDQKERKTRRHTVKIYKIQWNHHTEEKYLGFLQSRNREFFYLPCFS
jgi:hypothetical protein